MNKNKHRIQVSFFFLTVLITISLVFMAINSNADQPGNNADNYSNKNADNNGQPVFLILGDSLSAGYGVAREKNWVSLLQQRFNSKKLNLRIVNASISGDTTGNGLVRLPAALDEHRPAWLLIELGANDGLRGLPLSLLRSNLKKLILLGQQSQAQVLLMAIRIPPNYGKKYTQRFNALYTELAQETGVTLLPFMLNNIALYPELMQADRLHPTEQAQKIIMENIWEEIKGIVAAP